MERLFGTDGIRGLANESLSCELALQIGMAGAHVVASGVRTPRILLATDTRKSGDMLCAALAAGICAVGGDVAQLGVLPTPALPYLVRLYGADAAVMVTASHNSMEYNGIKWFSADGFKLSDAQEDEIEAIVNEHRPLTRPVGGAVGRVTSLRRAHEEYKEFLIGTASERLDGLTLVLDCANGAASGIAQDVFESLGAQVRSFCDEPDGYNINDQCGSTHPSRLQQLVYELGADVGLAFDGDADRLIAVDERGNLVDGDRIMGICALDMLERGTLKDNTLVLTVMSNLGLKNCMREHGIYIEETAVGDRYVLERMLEKKLSLGGEQSGHLIFLDHHRAGDGMLSAIQLLSVYKRSGKRMSRLAAQIPIYPQVLLNVRVQEEEKAAALAGEAIKSAIGSAEQTLGNAGRVLVRASGTEPLIRIMLEGPREDEIDALALSIARVVEANHGGKIQRP